MSVHLSKMFKVLILTLFFSSSCFAYPQVFEIVHQWTKLDFEYPNYKQRQNAIAKGEFILENNLPLGIDRYEDRLFVTTPRWKDGVPASLSYINYPNSERSPALKPYPDWQAHGDPYNPDCTKLMSVYRTYVDDCHRLWLIDAGIVNATVKLNQICLPKIVVFDLKTNKQLLSYELPKEQVKEDSLHSNIIVESNECHNSYAYVTDVWRYGLVVYSLKEHSSWRVTNYLFSPDPPSSDFQIYNLNFQWLDGIFGLSIFDQFLLYHPMASTKEFAIPLNYLHNSSLSSELNYRAAHAVTILGDRGLGSQSSTSGISRNGVMFFTQVQRDNIACWNTATPYDISNLSLLLKSNTGGLIRFPNDLKVDKDPHRESIWVMSNSLPIFLYGSLNYTEVNFRILRADVQQAIENTICARK